MADYELSQDGSVILGPVLFDGSHVEAIGVNMWNMTPPGTSAPVTVYKMRGMDAAVSGVYDTWLVTGSPDLDASDYHGALATPLRDVIVIDTWSS